MKSQDPSKFDRRATLKFCWWWNLFHSSAWLADKKEKLWNYSNRFEKKWRQHFGSFAMEWDHQHRRSAFLHEIGRRVDPDYAWKCPYIHLTATQRKELFQRWPVDESCLGNYEVGRLEDVPKAGWTPFKGLSFNLNRNDEGLMRELKLFIQHERMKLEIPNPKPNKGRRNRGFSWRPVELLDFQMHKNHVLNDAERSQVSKARKQYGASL